ncbi:hypothetical protein HBI49_237970 [Parastagonospora nodorum]|nr:hypothetical protein HBI49_237970 [Parastagonospora nodorum]
MSQTNVREGYRITTLEVVKLIEDLTIAKCTQLQNAQIPKVFHKAAVRQYGAKVKTEDPSNTPTLILSKTAQQQSSSVVSNRSTALITNKFSVASLTKPAILNDANIALVDAVHHSVVKQFPIFRLITKESQQKLEENYFKVMNALTMTLIKDDDDLLGTVNSHIKSRRLRAVMLLCQTTKPPGDSNKDRPPLKRRKTKAADSRHAKASRGRTKKDKDLEDSNTSSDQLGKKAQLKKTRDEEKLAKAKKEKEEKEAQNDDYRSDSSLDINPEDNSEDEEATTAKDLLTTIHPANKQTRTRDSLSARVGTAIEHCTLEEWTSAAVFFSVLINDLQNKRTIKLLAYAYILYFKELLSNNSRIFANAIGIGKTRAIVLATEVQNAQAEGDATEYNAVNNNNKLYPTKGERTFHCANPLALQFCFFSDSPLKNIGRLTKEEAIKMRINTTNAISKALAAANKLVAPQSYVLRGVDHQETATKHYPAPSAAQFIIVYGFRKVDKHMFRAYNTISVTAQRTIIRKGGPYIEKRSIAETPSHRTRQNTALNSLAIHDASEHKSSYKYKELISQGAAVACLCPDFLSTVQNAEQQCRDILEKEGLNKSEASRHVIFNRFKMQAIASYPALTTLKAAQFKTYSSCKVKRFTSNSVKDLFTNLSKDYFLVQEARAITKSSPKFQNLSNLCSKSIAAEDAAKAANTPPLPKEVRAKILIESYKPIVQAVTWLSLREKFSNESVLVMQRVALMAFAEAITLTEATHVVIIEPQDRQNTQDQFIIIYFNLDSKLKLKVLGKQDVKTTS